MPNECTLHAQSQDVGVSVRRKKAKFSVITSKCMQRLKIEFEAFFSLFVDVVPNRNLAQMRSVCKSVNNATKENVIALWVSPFVNIAQSKQQQQHYVLHIRCYSTQRRFRSLCTMLARSTHLFSAFLFANVTHYDEYRADAARIYTKTKR